MIIENIYDDPKTLPKLKIVIGCDELIDLIRGHTLCESFEVKTPNLGWLDFEVTLDINMGG